MSHATHTAADAERRLRDLQRDPAAKGYGDHLRRKGLLAERARSIGEFAQLRQSADRP